MKDLVIVNDLSSVLAPVNSVDAKSLFKNEAIRLPRGHEKAIVSGDKVFGYVSENFGLIKPMDVFGTFSEEFEKANIPFETLGKIDNRGNWELRFKFNNPNYNPDPTIRKVGDELSAMLAFGSGLAGTRGAYLNDMIHRLVCSNGMTRTISEIMLNKVRNTKNNQEKKFGIDFEKLIPLVLNFIEKHDFINEQKKLIDMELKTEQILPFFYEATKGTFFAESKFQTAYDRMKLEASELGYTAMNRYLALSGLNYVLEHDSMAMDLVKTKEADQKILSRSELNIGMAVKNFNAIVKAEKDRIEKYQAENDGKSPRGKRKVLELV